MRIEKSDGWVDVGLKVDPGRWSRWDEIGAVQVAIGHGQYEATISRGEARQVALALALGPDGTGKTGGTEAADNGRGSLGTGRAWMVGPVGTGSGSGWGALVMVPSTVPAGTSTRLAGIVTVWDVAGAILRTFRTLRNGKPRRDRAADRRVAEAARKAARTPEQVEADRAVGRARDAARRAARTPEQVEAHRLAERVRDASRRDAKQAAAAALLADGGAMRA